MTEPTIEDWRAQFYKQFASFVKDLSSETDRAAVILGTAKIDEMLYQLIGATLLPCTSGEDELLDGDKPLSTLSARINAAYRLGLITPEFARALHLLRKIRNAFAHDMSTMSFSAGAHRDRARELVAGIRNEESFGFLMRDFFEDKWEVGNEVRTAMALCSLRLEGAIRRAKCIDATKAVKLMPTKTEG